LLLASMYYEINCFYTIHGNQNIGIARLLILAVLLL